jgi:C-terminal peptidase prc
VLLAVDDIALDTAERRLKVVELVRGKAGTDVRLRLRRNEATRDVVVRRGDVQRPCVKWTHRLASDTGLGYVHLTDFHPDSAAQLFAAIDSLQQDGPLLGLVLDLRWNGGGSLEECLKIARAFLRSGLIVSQQRRQDVVVERHEATPETCRYPDLPLVLLVNEHSASASEVLAGALQDHDRAAIVGVRTHGKAFVNTVYQWKGHDFRLKLTTGRYHTPNGRDIERHHNAAEGAAESGGIPPDVDAPVAAEAKTAILLALQQKECPARHRAAFAAIAPGYGVTVHGPPQPATDSQLAQAFSTLRQRGSTATSGHSASGEGTSDEKAAKDK